MIEREELEKLIESGEIVWFVEIREPFTNEKHKNPILHKIDLHYSHLTENGLDTFELYYLISNEDFCDLYKKEEDAEWIARNWRTRPERFEPPTWEEFEQKNYYIFISRDGNKLAIEKLLCVDLGKENDFSSYGIVIIDVYDNEHKKLFEAEYTKKNYAKAVDLAKRLFLGEVEK